MGQGVGQANHDMGEEITVQNGYSPKRPLLLSRQSSHSKRHASFGSPREVPLPSPSSQLSQYFPYTITSSHEPKFSPGSKGQVIDSTQTINCPTFDRSSQSGSDSGDDSLPSAPSSPRPVLPSQRHSHLNRTEMNGSDHTGSYPDPQGRSTSRPREQSLTQAPESSRPRPQTTRSHNSAGLVFPWSRPYSLPQNYSNSFGPAGAIQSPIPTMPAWPDRSSSASLPLPMQTPYFTLPQIAPSMTVEEDQAMDMDVSSEGEAEVEHARTRPPRAPSQRNGIVNGSNGDPTSPQPTLPARTPPPPHRLDPLHTSSSSPPPAHSLPRSLSSSSTRFSYPAPHAPVILTPPPPPTGSGSAPYEPFLCHNALAEDRHSIAVETSSNEYNLVVRLPGFSRDAITLATRRRRILHIVADSWAPGGGHFERRVSFGYDADLAQVRAEFDGEILQVTIPRRTHPMMMMM